MLDSWLIAQISVGAGLLYVGWRRRRRLRWLLVGSFLASDALRGLTASVPAFVLPSTAVEQWVWGLTLPAAAVAVLGALYATFWILPAVVVGRLDDVPAGAVALVLLASGVIHALWAVPPPWWVGEAARPMASLPFFGSVMAADNAPLAALPSTHFAVPFAVALATRSKSWGVYAGLISAVVVVTGEHYIIDVLAGGVLAVVAVLVMSWAYPRALLLRGLWMMLPSLSNSSRASP